MSPLRAESLRRVEQPTCPCRVRAHLALDQGTSRDGERSTDEVVERRRPLGAIAIDPGRSAVRAAEIVTRSGAVSERDRRATFERACLVIHDAQTNASGNFGTADAAYLDFAPICPSRTRAGARDG
jgi:hypothetical protein